MEAPAHGFTQRDPLISQRASVPPLPPRDRGPSSFSRQFDTGRRLCLTEDVTFPGIGNADWVELDLDVFDIEQQVSVRSLLDAAADTLERLVGPDYEVEPSNDGTAHVVVGENRRYHAEVNAAGRLVLTVVPDPEGPL